MTDKSHLLRFGYAPGNYWFVCPDCGDKQAVGDKRATRCEACAESLHAQITSVEAVADKHRAMTTVPEEAVKAAMDEFNRTRRFMTSDTDRIYAAIAAALPHLPQGVGVKKLAWIRPPLSDTLSRCETDFGTYRTWTHDEANGKWFWSVERGWNEANGEALNEEDAKAAAQADYSARILSALEPSAAREMALEEAAVMLEAKAEAANSRAVAFTEKLSGPLKGRKKSEQWRSEKTHNERIKFYYQKAATAIRALSSPDHADAGKVEGDGWLPIESAPKDGTVIQAWHQVHKCPVSVLWKDGGFPYGGERLNWYERSYTTAWPERAFAHWRPLPAPPVGEVA